MEACLEAPKLFFDAPLPLRPPGPLPGGLRVPPLVPPLPPEAAAGAVVVMTDLPTVVTIDSISSRSSAELIVT